MTKLAGKRIAILVAEGVEDLEYYVPLMRLQEEGAEVLSAAVKLEPVKGKNGLEITPDTLVDSLSSDDLAGIVIPGGWAPDKRYSLFLQQFSGAVLPKGKHPSLSRYDQSADGDPRR